MRHLTAKLLVEPGHRVLMLGAKDNRLAEYIEKVTGASVDSVTSFYNTVGPYDRLISVGVFEGQRDFKAYFKRIFTTVQRNSVVLLHGIGEHKRGSSSGYPAISELLTKVEATNFLIKDLEIIPGDQASFLSECRARTNNVILATYLENHAEAFRSQSRFLYELQLSPFQDSVPFTRDYISENEARLAEREKEIGLID